MKLACVAVLLVTACASSSPPAPEECSCADAVAKARAEETARREVVEKEQAALVAKTKALGVENEALQKKVKLLEDFPNHAEVVERLDELLREQELIVQSKKDLDAELAPMKAERAMLEAEKAALEVAIEANSKARAKER